MSDLIGQTLGNYRIESLIGSGGMGQVYRGVHVHLNRPVAVKVMHAHLARDANFRTRFLREANAAARLNHPNVIKVQDFGEVDGTAYLIMELATGGSLRTLLQRHASSGQPLSWRAGIPLVLQAAEALDYAHSQGMVHRDIKPDNLLLQPLEGRAALLAPPEAPFSIKICDFGVAQLRSDGRVTATGVTVGTPAYISPEQCQGLDLDGRSDIYSLGVVLYEIATGYLPFETKTMAEALYKHVNTPPPPPRGVRPDVPADLEAAILRCLTKRPEDRFQTARQLADALRAILAAFTPPPAAPSAERAAALGAVASAAPGVFDATLVPGAAVAPGTSAPAVPGGVVSRPTLLILDRDGHQQATFDLPNTGAVVGRGRDADLLLDDPKVSRHHLRVDWDGREATVTDLGSGNGTWLGGARIAPNLPQPWPAGAVLVIGPYGLRLEAPGAPTIPALPNVSAPRTAAPLGAHPSNGSTAPSAPATGSPPAPRPLPGVRFTDSSRAAPAAPVTARTTSGATGSPRLLVAQRNGQLRPVAPLTTGGVTVGRDHDNLVVLANRQVSRHHLRIDWDGTQAAVVDLGSGNGTWLHNTRLTPRVPQPWTAEADLKIGPFLLRLDPTGAYGLPGDGRAADVDLEFPSLEAVSAGRAGATRTASRLVVMSQDEQPLRTLDLAEGSVSIGRAKDNQVVLDDRKVSRRHLQVAWDGYQATVVDAGSDNGTWIGDVKLSPDSPHLWPPTEPLRVGPFLLRLETAVVAAADSGGLHTAVGSVQMLLDQRTLELTPGQPAIVRGTVANLGNIVDHFHVTVDGVPKSWISGESLRQEENAKIQLNPGAQAPVVLTVTPPRTPESRAGEYLVNVLAHSAQSDSELGVAQAVWTVLPFTGSVLSIERSRIGGRRRATVGVTVENKGNAPTRFTLGAAEEERALTFGFGQDVLAPEPGQGASVPLTVRSPWYWIGTPRSRPFRVQAVPEQGEPPPVVPAEFLHQPVLPQWVPRLAAGLIPIILIVAILLQNFLIGWLRPDIRDFAAPRSVIEGQPVTLSWSVQRAQRVQIDGLEAKSEATPAPLPGSGQQTIAQGLNKDQEFKLVASNLFGPVERSRVVAVMTLTPVPTATATPTPLPTATPEIPVPVIEEFTVQPRTIVAGQQVTITWCVRDAQVVTIEGLSTAQLSACGQLPHRPERTTSYLLSASNQGRPAEPRAVEVIVQTPTPSPTVPPTATPPPTPQPAPSGG